MTGPTGPAGSASTNAAQVVITTTGTSASFFPTFASATAGTLPLYAQSSLSYNPGNAILSSGGITVTSGVTTPTNGMFLPAASTLAFSTATSERMRIDSQGNIGIGTSTVFAAAANRTSLSVNGPSSSLLGLGAAGTMRGYVYTDGTNAYVTATTGQLQVTTDTDSGIVFFTSSTERAKVDSNGVATQNSFISKGYLIADSNTSAPNVFTRIFGGGSIVGSSFVAMLSGNDGINRYRNSTAHVWENQNGTSEFMRVDISNSRVGIMTSNPQFTLDVNGTTRLNGTLTLGSLLSLSNGLSITGGGLITTNVSVTGATVPTNGIYLPATNVLGFATSSGERMRIDATGNAAIGSTSTTAARLFVTAASNLAGVPMLRIDDPATSNGASLAIFSTSNAAGAGIGMYGNGATTPNKFIRATGGQLQIVNSAYTAVILTLTDAGALSVPSEITAYSSDGRLKGNVSTITDALSKVLSIDGVTFEWLPEAKKVGFAPSRKRDVGVIAQRIQEVLPEAVATAPFDRDPQDPTRSKSGENYLTVQYEKLTALLIEAVKELANKVEALEAKLAGND